ncbi:MAG: retropepsin-like domain-containing protein [Candidatus Eremiobacteraeota bacterium]|nr:retropepsin-like domain-containing protein [Candidatus Eremiobacteraeota bacterium]
MYVAILAGLLSVSIGRADEPTNDDSPPAGIQPTTASLSQVLKAHELAVGTSAKVSPPVRTESWTFTKDGQQGAERIVRRGTDYHATITSGPFAEEYGQLGDARWYVNQNGAVTASDRTDISAFDMFRVLEDASDPKNDVKLLGTVASPSPAYVVEVTRPGFKHREWVFIDTKTSLITQTQRRIGKFLIVSTYDGYQTTQGLTEPTHIHDSEATGGLEDDYKRESITFSSSADPSEFTKPQPRETFMQVSQPSSIDGRVTRGTVIVRLTIAGRGLDFELSSGDGQSYIDSDVARELGLPAFGHATASNGSPLPYETRIDEAMAGDVELKNFALEVIPFHYHADADTKIVGTLGYDFLSCGLFIVDYVNHRVSVAPNTDAPPEPDMYFLPVTFDDGRPFFTSTIGSHETNNVLLDSSFLYSVIFGSFTGAYPEAVVDMSNGKQHTHTIVPFADGGTYGRDIDIWIASVPDIHIGPTHYINYRILATNWGFEGERPVDAVMGTQFLAFYDVYYDFAHSRVYLKPNDFFHRSFKPHT